MDTQDKMLFDVADKRFRLLLGTIKNLALAQVSSPSIMQVFLRNDVPHMLIEFGAAIVTVRMLPQVEVLSAVLDGEPVTEVLTAQYMEALAAVDPAYQFFHTLSQGLNVPDSDGVENRVVSALAEKLLPRGIDFARDKFADILGAAVGAYFNRSFTVGPRLDEDQLSAIGRLVRFVNGTDVKSPLDFSKVVDIVDAFRDACSRVLAAFPSDEVKLTNESSKNV